MRRAVAAAIVLAGVALAITVGIGRICFWTLCSSSPMSFGETDLDHNGRVSWTEADYVCNFGQRQVTSSGKQCTEYYALKDGLPLKIVCR
jgi:hypothetical protein